MPQLCRTTSAKLQSIPSVLYVIFQGPICWVFAFYRGSSEGNLPAIAGCRGKHRYVADNPV